MMNIRNFKKPLPKFTDEVVWRDLERQCYDGTIEYEDFPADEYKYFDQLRIVYLKYKFADMPKKEAAERKRLLLTEYKNSKVRDKEHQRVLDTYQGNIKRFERLRIAVNKASTESEKLRPALEMIGIITGEESFAERNLKGV